MNLETLGRQLATSLIVQKVLGEAWPWVYIPGFQKCPGGGTSLVVQWLRLPAPNAGVLGSIPGQGNETPHGTTTDLTYCKKMEDPACHDEDPAQPKKERNILKRKKCLGEPELTITAQIYPVLTKNSFY